MVPTQIELTYIYLPILYDDYKIDRNGSNLFKF